MWRARQVRYESRRPVLHAFPDHLRVLTDQRAAWQRATELVAASSARGGGHHSRLAVLRVLVEAMDWAEGYVTGLTHAMITDRSGVPARTVSAVLAWARAVELVSTAESPASAAVMGTAHGRTATYALVAPIADDHGDPPTRKGEQEKPLGRGLNRSRGEPTASYPRRDRADTADERGRASDELLGALGVPRPLWPRARALLSRWWLAGACVSGLLYAIDHHPDGTPRGDALRGARDPLGLLGFRLGAWDGRLPELPASRRAVHVEQRRAHAVQLAAELAELDDAGRRERPEHVERSSAEHRAALLAGLRRTGRGCRGRTPSWSSA